MKKSFYLLGLATVALASCTNEEVMEMPENRAIQFDTFVNNTTRSVTEATGAPNFYVFGNYGYSADNAGMIVYNNESNSKVAYWQPSQTYRFGAYVDGDAKNANATFDPNAGSLTITGYTPSDANDLMAAVSGEVTTGADVTSQGAVPLTFKHLLSIVKFTFTTDDADTYTLAISNLKINGAAAQGNVIYNGTTTWTPTGTDGYTFDGIADVAVEANGYTDSSAEFVIPQSGTDQLTVTFTATVNGGGLTNVTGNFTANLGYTPGVTEDDEPDGTTANTWTPGYRYNYTANINASDIDPTLEKKKIEFKPTVDTWKDTNDTEYTPTTQN